MHSALLTWAALLATFADEPLAPWASNHDPSDVPRQHVQEVASGPTRYQIVQGGTMDGRNCRTPQGVWEPFRQTWESNRSVRIENVGDGPVVTPWLVAGRGNFRSLDQIVASAVAPGMTDREAARALWWQEVQHRFHLDGDNTELLDPVKVFNVYGYNTCGNDSICMAGLWRKAGLKVAPARLVGHCVSQVFYDGGWHLMDGDMHSIYLLRDNETVAGEQELVRDHDLIRRTHTQGLLHPDNRASDEWESSIYVYEGRVGGDRSSGGAPLSMTLRPGEALVWRWGHREPIKYHGSSRPRFPDRVCNGLWEYRPDLARDAWRAGADRVEHVQKRDDGLASEDGTTGSIVWSVHTPYIIVGGALEVEGTGARFAISWDGRTWQDVREQLDAHFPPDGPARYSYFLKCELPGAARLRKLAIVNDLQMAPLALPAMNVGRNEFTYTDDGARDRKVRITHRWVERSASAPPGPAPEPIEPRNGGDAEGTDVVFRWRPASDPDGDAIADYHFELSSRADMKWPLSMSFAKLISRTADAGQARYTLPGAGLLNPDQKYYWHVRAQDARGVWGPWSATWTFTPRGPAPPTDVAVQFDADRSTGTLHWSPAPRGRRPAAFRVYASDEKGFSISDRSYKATVGVSKDVPDEFPPNFIAEILETKLTVIGSDARRAPANRAFYRVVAVDASGKRSGPSDYAEAPRPIIVSAPVTTARRGAPYRYQAAAIRSIGDLRTRVIGGKETMGFWDVERPRFALERGPRWLKVDAATGMLSGTPDHVGKLEVVVSVTLERDQRQLDEASLMWGIEKVVASGVEHVGRSTQSYVVDVAP